MTAKALTESRFKVSLTSQKTFEPWSGSVGEEVALDDDKKAGWNAYEMQQANENKMCYVSEFNELEFTTPLDALSPGYKERALQAKALARIMDREKSLKRSYISDSGHERSEEQRYGSVSMKVDKNNRSLQNDVVQSNVLHSGLGCTTVGQKVCFRQTKSNANSFFFVLVILIIFFLFLLFLVV